MQLSVIIGTIHVLLIVNKTSTDSVLCSCWRNSFERKNARRKYTPAVIRTKCAHFSHWINTVCPLRKVSLDQTYSHAIVSFHRKKPTLIEAGWLRNDQSESNMFSHGHSIELHRGSEESGLCNVCRWNVPTRSSTRIVVRWRRFSNYPIRTKAWDRPMMIISTTIIYAFSTDFTINTIN